MQLEGSYGIVLRHRKGVTHEIHTILNERMEKDLDRKRASLAFDGAFTSGTWNQPRL